MPMPASAGLRFRAACPGDAHAIAGLDADSWRRHYRGAYSDAFLDNDAAGYLLPLWTGRLAIPNPQARTILAVTTKTSRIEPLAQIKARLREASSLIDAERLALSPQCGFATSVAGNAITPEAQRAKIALLVRAARDFLPAATTT
jgi:hypothetical protein